MSEELKPCPRCIMCGRPLPDEKRYAAEIDVCDYCATTSDPRKWIGVIDHYRRPAPEAKAGGEGDWIKRLAKEVCKRCDSEALCFDNDCSECKSLILSELITVIEKHAPAAGVGLTGAERETFQELIKATERLAKEGKETCDWAKSDPICEPMYRQEMAEHGLKAFGLLGKMCAALRTLLSRAEGLTKENVRKWCGHDLPLPETGEYQCLYKEDGLSRTCPESDCPIIRGVLSRAEGGE